MSAITSLPSNAASTGVRPQGIGLDAQLGRLQKELAECINCASAKTTGGQAKIQAISDKISAIKSRINDAPSSIRNNETQQAIKAQDAQQQIAQQVNNVPPNPENRPILDAAVGRIINISV